MKSYQLIPTEKVLYQTLSIYPTPIHASISTFLILLTFLFSYFSYFFISFVCISLVIIPSSQPINLLIPLLNINYLFQVFTFLQSATSSEQRWTHQLPTSCLCALPKNYHLATSATQSTLTKASIVSHRNPQTILLIKNCAETRKCRLHSSLVPSESHHNRLQNTWLVALFINPIIITP